MTMFQVYLIGIIFFVQLEGRFFSNSTRDYICERVQQNQPLDLFCVGFYDQNNLMIITSKATGHLVYILPRDTLNQATHKWALTGPHKPIPMKYKWPSLYADPLFIKVNAYPQNSIFPFTAIDKSNNSYLVMYTNRGKQLAAGSKRGLDQMDGVEFELKSLKIQGILSDRYKGSLQEFVSANGILISAFQHENNTTFSLVERRYDSISRDAFIGDQSEEYKVCYDNHSISVSPDEKCEHNLVWPKMVGFVFLEKDKRNFYMFDKNEVLFFSLPYLFDKNPEAKANPTKAYANITKRAYRDFFDCPLPPTTAPTTAPTSTISDASQSNQTEQYMSSTEKKFLLVLIVVVSCVTLVLIIAIGIAVYCLFCAAAASGEDKQKKKAVGTKQAREAESGKEDANKNSKTETCKAKSNKSIKTGKGIVESSSLVRGPLVVKTKPKNQKSEIKSSKAVKSSSSNLSKGKTKSAVKSSKVKASATVPVRSGSDNSLAKNESGSSVLSNMTLRNASSISHLGSNINSSKLQSKQSTLSTVFDSKPSNVSTKTKDTLGSLSERSARNKK